MLVQKPPDSATPCPVRRVNKLERRTEGEREPGKPNLAWLVFLPRARASVCSCFPFYGWKRVGWGTLLIREGGRGESHPSSFSSLSYPPAEGKRGSFDRKRRGNEGRGELFASPFLYRRRRSDAINGRKWEGKMGIFSTKVSSVLSTFPLKLFSIYALHPPC